MTKEKIHQFTIHQSGCINCQKVDIAKTSSLSLCCLIGAPLLRDFLNCQAAPSVRNKNKQLKKQFIQESDGKVYLTSEKKLSELIKYK